MALSDIAFQSFRTGQLSAFYAEAYPGLLTFAARKLGSEYAFLAEDCVQEAIFSTYERRQLFDRPAALLGFLYTSLFNRIVSVLRHEDVHSRYVEDSMLNDSEMSEDLQLEMIRQETLTRLFRAIDRLPEELRQIFDLNFEQGLTLAEVAKQLGVSDSTVKRRKQQLIDHLRGDLLRCLMLLMV